MIFNDNVPTIHVYAFFDIILLRINIDWVFEIADLINTRYNQRVCLIRLRTSDNPSTFYVYMYKVYN